MKKEYTCVVCPEGCRITVDLDAGGKVVSVAGNKCRRGDAYVRQESVAPKRNISTTVALKGAERPVCPVKTSVPIPRKKSLSYGTLKKGKRYRAGADWRRYYQKRCRNGRGYPVYRRYFVKICLHKKRRGSS